MSSEIATIFENIERELNQLRRFVADGGGNAAGRLSVSLREAERLLNKSPRTILRHAVRDDAATKNGGGRWQIDMCKLSLKVPRQP